MKFCLFMIFSFTLFLSSCGESSHETSQIDITPILILSNVAGKTKSEVEGALGTGSGTEVVINNGVSYPKEIYLNGQIEIVYVNEKADWITVYFQELFYEELSSFQKAAFRPSVIRYLGLEEKEPASSSAANMRWDSIPSILEISAFPNDLGNVRYVYIVASTRP